MSSKTNSDTNIKLAQAIEALGSVLQPLTDVQTLCDDKHNLSIDISMLISDCVSMMNDLEYWLNQNENSL